MHGLGLAEALERQIAAQLRKGLVVWLDKDGLYSEFVDRLAERRAQGQFLAPVVALRGSFLEVALALASQQEGLDSEPLLLHLPGYSDASIRATPLLEAYRAGTRFERALPTLIREVAAGQVAPQEVERFLQQEALTLEGAEQWLQRFLRQERSGLASNLAPWRPEALLFALVSESWPSDISPEECPVLLEYIERHCGLCQDFLEAYLGGSALQGRTVLEAWVAWLLCLEYVNDLSRPPSLPLLQSLRQLSSPLRKTCLALVEALRQHYPEHYRRLAQQVESWIEPDLRSGRPEELGRIDTFSREDSRLLEAAVEALQQQEWSRSLEWANQRLSSPSIWLESEPLRGQEWQLVRVAALLGQRISAHPAPLREVQSLSQALEAYGQGLYQVDQAHRHFEQDRLRLLEPRLVHFEALSGATKHLRSLYHAWVDRLHRDFTELCLQQGFLPEASLQQRTLYEQVVHPMVQSQRTVAYFLVDALRYEMAAELAQRLQKPGLNLQLKLRLAELPSITRVGMNVLAPVSRNGQLKVDGDFKGFRAGEYVVNSPKRRLQAMAERSLGPGRPAPHLSLRQILEEAPPKLKGKPLLVVHSREIDSSGESDLGIATFETWLGQLYSAIQLLHNAGVDQFVVTSDHGFLLVDESREPLSQQGERRYLLGDSPLQQDSTVSVSTASLAYEGTSSYLHFPRDSATFRSQGRTAQTFVHGGNSLQERAIPVLTLSFRSRELVGLGQYLLEAQALPKVVNFSRLRVRVREGESLMLGFEKKTVAIALRALGPSGEVPRVNLIQVGGVSGAVLQHQQLLLTVGEDWAEVIFTLEGGSLPRAALELYHPDGQEKLEPQRLPEFFEVTGFSEKQNPYCPAWEGSIEDPGHRQVLLHLETFGVVDEDQITQILGEARATRRFARSFEAYLTLLPFEIFIDSQGPLKRYVKKG